MKEIKDNKEIKAVSYIQVQNKGLALAQSLREKFRQILSANGKAIYSEGTVPRPLQT
jgi:hypothetical protein